MKIIGTSNNGYILEANKNEMALLRGFRNNYTGEYVEPTVGAELEIIKIDRVSRFVRTMDKEKLQRIKSDLDSAINEIDQAVELAQSLTLFATLEDDDADD